MVRENVSTLYDNVLSLRSADRCLTCVGQTQHGLENVNALQLSEHVTDL